MTNPSPNSEDAKGWQIQSLRTTAFPISPPFEFDDLASWEKLVGETPESQNSKPGQGLTETQGSWHGSELVLRSKPRRIEWVLSTPSQQEDLENPPTMGQFPEAAERFLDLSRNWLALDSVPGIQRLALGAVLLAPVGSREEGYEFINSRLHSVTLTPETTDFIYQINRPTQTKVSGDEMKINRLSRWTVQQWKTGSLDLDCGALVVQAEPLSHQCKLHLDINSSQEFEGEISREARTELLDRLKDMAVEISERGEPK